MIKDASGEYVERLYNELFYLKDKFSKNVIWIAVEAIGSKDKNKYSQMWTIYRKLIYKVGGDIILDDVQWNSESSHTEEVIDLLFNKGYNEIIVQLIDGAINIFSCIERESKFYPLKNKTIPKLKLEILSDQHKELFDKYLNVGELTSLTRKEKWDYINHIDDLLNSILEIVEREIKKPSK